MTQDEPGRLASLQMYQIMDTANEKAFDDLTSLAAGICEAPISLVSLVDESRQWFKSHFGLTATQTPRGQAFCSHAIEQMNIMIVEDASIDPRFSENPLVTGNPNIRFYAGAPLVVEDGSRLGTLCVIDQKPRQLTEYQLAALSVLRDAVVTQLELRRALADFKSLKQLIPICAWCRSVRTQTPEGESWQPLHTYMVSVAPVTHSICPECESKQE